MLTQKHNLKNWKQSDRWLRKHGDYVTSVTYQPGNPAPTLELKIRKTRKTRRTDPVVLEWEWDTEIEHWYLNKTRPGQRGKQKTTRKKTGAGVEQIRYVAASLQPTLLSSASTEAITKIVQKGRLPGGLNRYLMESLLQNNPQAAVHVAATILDIPETLLHNHPDPPTLSYAETDGHLERIAKIFTWPQIRTIFRRDLIDLWLQEMFGFGSVREWRTRLDRLHKQEKPDNQLPAAALVSDYQQYVTRQRLETAGVLL